MMPIVCLTAPFTEDYMDSTTPAKPRIVLGRNLVTEKKVTLPHSALAKHCFALGSTGSGKTVLGKAFIEENTRHGIPSIVIDPQGDLASLILKEYSEIVHEQGLSWISDDYHSKAEVRIFTPVTSRGIPICINPFKPVDRNLPREELTLAMDLVATSLAQLAYINPESERGRPAKTLISIVLERAHRDGIGLENFDNFARLIRNPSELGFSPEERARLEAIAPEKLRQWVAGKILPLGEGIERLMFNFGAPLNVDMFMTPTVEGRVPVNIIYLNTLRYERHKQFFVMSVAKEIYDWMLQHPSQELQLFFYMDEVGPFVPPHPHNPPAKLMISNLFKQGRKYGVGCMMATQNPADVDYKVVAQANTLCFGRMMQKQDVSKIKELVRSTDPMEYGFILKTLPALKPGEFLLISPDTFKGSMHLRTRWLVTHHKTLNEIQVQQLVPYAQRQFFAGLFPSRAGDFFPEDISNFESVIPRPPGSNPKVPAAGWREVVGGGEPPLPLTEPGEPVPESGNETPYPESHLSDNENEIENEIEEPENSSPVFVYPVREPPDAQDTIESQADMESPDTIESPAKLESPDTIESPTDMKSPDTIESPTDMESPDTIESPTDMKSPDTIESPTDMESPDTIESPASPKKEQMPGEPEVLPGPPPEFPEFAPEPGLDTGSTVDRDEGDEAKDTSAGPWAGMGFPEKPDVVEGLAPPEMPVFSLTGMEESVGGDEYRRPLPGTTPDTVGAPQTASRDSEEKNDGVGTGTRPAHAHEPKFSTHSCVQYMWRLADLFAGSWLVMVLLMLYLGPLKGNRVYSTGTLIVFFLGVFVALPGFLAGPGRKRDESALVLHVQKTAIRLVIMLWLLFLYISILLGWLDAGVNWAEDLSFASFSVYAILWVVQTAVRHGHGEGIFGVITEEHAAIEFIFTEMLTAATTLLLGLLLYLNHLGETLPPGLRETAVAVFALGVLRLVGGLLAAGIPGRGRGRRG